MKSDPDTINKEMDSIGTIPEISQNKQLLAISEFLTSRRLSQQTIKECGGFYEGRHGDYFYGYLVFRLMDGSLFSRKILDIPGHKFKTQEGSTRLLLGMENIPNYTDLILCESITDFLTLWELGFRNIVCSLGVSLSALQAYYLRGKTVFILYDRDFAGYEGAEAAKVLLGQYKARAIPLEIPSGFGIGMEKVDVSSAYLKNSQGFAEWLKYRISEYGESDRNYIELLVKRQVLPYYATGITGLDAALNGGFTQGLYGIGGETSVGKSTLVNIFCHSFISQKKKVLIENFELPKSQIWARYASTYSGHNWVDIEKDPTILEMDVVARLREDSNYLKVAADGTVDEMLVRARDTDIVIVDYLQRMPNNESSVNEGIRKNNLLLSELTMQGKTVIVLSSMPRSEYNSEGKVNIFKGSGDIEYTMQAGVRLYKVSDNRMFIDFIKNTRGRLWRGYLNLDWEHQSLISQGE